MEDGSTGPARERYDAVVLGGGPAGATAAAILAKEGREVLLVEREQFPRFHIGESLLPAYQGVMQALGISRDNVESTGVPKRGATFMTACGSRSGRIEFAGAPGVENGETLHVVRADFDRVLFEHARDVGAEILCRAEAQSVALAGATAQVDVVCGTGRAISIAADYLIDASGRTGIVSRSVGCRVQDPALRNAALFGHYRGVRRPTGRADGDIRIVVLEGGGWAWLIPLPGDVTSIGFVLPAGTPLRHPGESPAAALERWIMATPVIRGEISTLERIGDVRGESDYSYSTSAYCGANWLLAGDAGSFLDPVFSTGVQLALVGGKEAGEAVAACLRGSPTARKRVLRRYDREQRRRYRFFRQFVLGFYQPGFRHLLLSPESWPWVARAVASALAGVDRPGLSTRLGLGIMFLAARLQRIES